MSLPTYGVDSMLFVYHFENNEEFGPAAFIMRARAEGLRDFGACMSPTNAFHILQGVETLPLRMRAASARAACPSARMGITVPEGCERGGDEAELCMVSA